MPALLGCGQLALVIDLESEFLLIAAFLFRCGRFLERLFDRCGARGTLDPLPFHQLLHRAELEAREFLFVGLVLVETNTGGFGFHRTGGRLERN